MSKKQVRAQYTQEFKREAVRQVRSGQAIAVVATVLGMRILAGDIPSSGRCMSITSADPIPTVQVERSMLPHLRWIPLRMTTVK